MFKKWVMLAGFVLVLSPAAARADWLFTPHLGSTFGNGGGNLTYGATLGWMGAGYLGWETEIAFVPSFLDIDVTDDDPDTDIDLDLLDDQAMTLMFNAIVGLPAGGTGGGGFRPYFSGGLGVVTTSIQSDDLLFDESDNKFGFNLGGGAMAYFGNVGIRGDLRYYQTLAAEELDEALNLEIGDFDFWRGTVGVTFRW